MFVSSSERAVGLAYSYGRAGSRRELFLGDAGLRRRSPGRRGEIVRLLSLSRSLCRRSSAQGPDSVSSD